MIRLTKSSPGRKLVPLCLFGAFALAAPAVYAAPFTISASYNLGTSSGSGATPSPQTDCGDTGTGGRDALIFTGSGPNNIGIHTYGCVYSGSFSFGSRSSGENTYFVDGKMNLATTTTGDTFTFFVNPGRVGSFGSTAFTAGEFQHSMLTIKLVINGVTEIDDSWETGVGADGVLIHNESHTGLLQVGSSLTTGPGDLGYASYQIFGGPFTISGLNNGDSIAYDITSEANGNILATTTACQAPVGGALPAAFEGNGAFDSFCGAGAQTGDPFPPLARPFEAPEPASAALLGLGAAMLAFARLKRRRKDSSH